MNAQEATEEAHNYNLRNDDNRESLERVLGLIRERASKGGYNLTLNGTRRESGCWYPHEDATTFVVSYLRGLGFSVDDSLAVYTFISW